jgi:peptidoglycan hydrolase CwlO-like protein
MNTSLIITIIISVILFIGGVAVSIIGYFLRQTMDNLDKTKEATISIRKDLDVLTKDHQNKHESITEKFDDLKDSIIILTNEIKQLTAKIK